MIAQTSINNSTSVRPYKKIFRLTDNLPDECVPLASEREARGISLCRCKNGTTTQYLLPRNVQNQRLLTKRKSTAMWKLGSLITVKSLKRH